MRTNPVRQKLLAGQPVFGTFGWEFLVPLVSPLTDTLFDLASDPLVLIEEPETTFAELDHLHAKLAGEFEGGRHGKERLRVCVRAPRRGHPARGPCGRTSRGRHHA